MTYVKNIEVKYRGFEIIKVEHSTYGTMFYKIHKDGEQESSLCLASHKAAKNVIDTHINNIKKQSLLWNS